MRRPGLDNLIRYLRGVGADLCTLQALLDDRSEPLLATTDEEATDDWRQLRAAFERALSDEALERRVRSVLEGLAWDSGSLVKDARSTASDNTEIPVRELPLGHAGSSQKALEPLVRIGRQVGWDARKLNEELRAARRDVNEIVRLDSGRRCAKIKGAYKRFRGPIFATLLLEEARRAIPGDPAESLSLADAAVASCERTYPSEPDPQVQVPAMAVRGNAKRALGRLREAEEDLQAAVELLDGSDLHDPAVAAEIDFYLGSLRKDQRRLEEAARHLVRASVLYSVLRDRDKAAATLLKLGIVHHRGHRHDEAVEAAEEALELLDAGSEAWLRAYAHYNLALFLHARGDLERAEEELATHEEIIRAADGGLAFRAIWLRARIAWNRQELTHAERLFTEAHQRAQERGIAWDSGFVGLELALVHLSRGRTARARKLADEALRIFSDQNVERETRAALEVLEEAVRREALTRKLLERAVATLERGRHLRANA